MPNKRTNAELAALLTRPQVDGTILQEAAQRLRDFDLQQLLTMNEVVQTVNESTAIDEHTSRIVEQVVTAIPISKRSTEAMASLAARILQGRVYDDQDVKSLAASVLAQYEEPQS